MPKKAAKVLTEIQLKPGEAYVVLDKKFWDHMVQWHDIMARDTSDPVDKENWESVRDVIRDWVDYSYVPREDEY